MKRNRQAIMIAIACLSLPAQAAAPDWKSLMSGVDGVITFCDSSTRQSYAASMCEAVSAEVARLFEGSGLAVRHTGMVLTGVASDDKTPAEVATAPLKQAPDMKQPLLAGIILKGTDDGNPAIYMRVQFTLPVETSADAASGLAARKGELFVLERAVVGNGPKKRLPAAQIAYIKKVVAPVIADIRAALPGG